MLHDVSKIAGMKVMLIVHEKFPSFKEARQPPRTAGILALPTWHAFRRMFVQSRKVRSLPRQMRTSVSHFRWQEIDMVERERPGLALTNASATSAGVTSIGLSGSRYSGGMLIRSRAFRTFSK